MTKLIVGDYYITFMDKRESLSVIQIKEGLWRKLNDLKPLFSRNEELYVSKEVKENALASKGKSSIMPTGNNNLRKSRLRVATSQYETGGKNHIVC